MARTDQTMKVLLTVGYDGDRDVLETALLDEATKFVDGANASRVSVDVRIGPDEPGGLTAADNERDAAALVSLWDVESAPAALKFTLPDGARLVGAYVVDEVTQRDYERTWPAGDTSPGWKMVCLVRRKADISHEAYLKHWRENHGPLALKHQPGFWHYVQNHIVDYVAGDATDVDGIGEIHYRTLDAVQNETFDSEDGRIIIYADTLRFMDHDRSTVLVSKETLVP